MNPSFEMEFSSPFSCSSGFWNYAADDRVERVIKGLKFIVLIAFILLYLLLRRFHKRFHSWTVELLLNFRFFLFCFPRTLMTKTKISWKLISAFVSVTSPRFCLPLALFPLFLFFQFQCQNFSLRFRQPYRSGKLLVHCKTKWKKKFTQFCTLFLKQSSPVVIKT